METTAACDARCGNRGCAHAGDDAHLERGGVARLGQGLLVGSGSGLSLLTLGLFAVRTRSLVGSGSTGTVGVTVLGAGLGVTAGDGAVAILGLGSLVGIREVRVCPRCLCHRSREQDAPQVDYRRRRQVVCRLPEVARVFRQLGRRVAL